MGEGTPGVEPRKLEREIEHLRTRLDRSLAELDRRRHELTDMKLQARRHPGMAIGAGIVVLALAGGAALALWRSRKRTGLPEKARRIQIAFGRALDRPHKEAEPPIWEKIVAAVGTTIAVGLTKKLLDRAWNATYTGRRSPAAPPR